ncbi:MAG: hypothetical protein ACREQP_04875 [Candidatus Binatia bacterium]
MSENFFCGPLQISLNAPQGALGEKFIETFGVYDVAWEPPHLPVKINVVYSGAPAPRLAGTYLECARMKVDADPAGLLAACPSGVVACFDETQGAWVIAAPPEFDARARSEDTEDLIALVLTTGWRRAGWVPMHAAAVVNGSRCVFLCAPPGGGKTSLTAALIRRQWRTLGDDKLLLRRDGGEKIELAALTRHLNLHRKTQEWFAEIGDLERLPLYSTWTEKRKVNIDDVWKGRAASRGSPTHLVSLARRERESGVKIGSLPRAEVLSTLLRQTVIPRDRKIAAEIQSAVAAAARRLQGLRVEIGEEAYRDPDSLDALERALH